MACINEVFDTYKELGETDSAFARRVGLHKELISKFRRGEIKDPRCSTLIKFYKGLKLTPNQLLEIMLKLIECKDSGQEK